MPTHPHDHGPIRPSAHLPERIAEPGAPTISFELYPPRSPAGEVSLQRAIEHLVTVVPDFLSVTYGASGSSRETSREVVAWIIANTDVPPVAHLTCLGAPAGDVRAVVDGLVAVGVRDFLALRGDPPVGEPDWAPDPHGLHRASQLVELLRETERDLGEPLSVGVAASPAALHGDPAACGDLVALLAKQEAGADYAITQVFFDPQDYIRYVAAARDAGVHLPLLPGIVPLVDPRRLRRLEQISGVGVPTRILRLLEDGADDEHRRVAGRDLGVELLTAVLDAGAPGVHLYTFNQHAASLDLLAGAGLGAPVR